MNRVINFLIQNWAAILMALILMVLVAEVVVTIVEGAKDFFRKPKQEQITEVKEWLLYACTEAERALGSGTGEIKLRYVYDMFLSRFPLVANMFTFSQFETLVNLALDELEDLAKANNSVNKLLDDGSSK